MARPPYSQVSRALRAIEESRDAGWPLPGSPYESLLHAEMTAQRITHLGGLPGVLMDMDFVMERQRRAHMPPAQAQRNNRLHTARQIISADRMARGELQQGAIVSTDVAMPVFEVTPDRTAPQLQKLVDAADAGWDIKAVRPLHLVDALGPNTYSLILIGDPAAPEAVYWEAADQTVEPHESWRTDIAATAGAAAAHGQLSSDALTADITADMFRRMHEFFAPAA
ncbi:MAG TPA: hypothetical protein VLF62_06640 [Candidatus Saccharimonadales bacterium]|nr:hypothetical protein [Candidatus Saccharimonadales bacterium]